MEFDDIVFGVMGYFVMFAVFSAVRGIYHGIRWFIKNRLVAEEATVYDTARRLDSEHTESIDYNSDNNPDDTKTE